MSNHHSHKAIDLHHSQVSAGRSRRLHRQAERQLRYLTKREEGRMEYHIMLALGFGGFAYIMLVTAVYLRYLI